MDAGRGRVGSCWAYPAPDADPRPYAPAQGRWDPGARHRTGSTTLRQQWRQRPPIAAGWCGGQPRSVGRCARPGVGRSGGRPESPGRAHRMPAAFGMWCETTGCLRSRIRSDLDHSACTAPQPHAGPDPKIWVGLPDPVACVRVGGVSGAAPVPTPAGSGGRMPGRCRRIGGSAPASGLGRAHVVTSGPIGPRASRRSRWMVTPEGAKPPS